MHNDCGVFSQGESEVMINDYAPKITEEGAQGQCWIELRWACQSVTGLACLRISLACLRVKVNQKVLPKSVTGSPLLGIRG